MPDKVRRVLFWCAIALMAAVFVLPIAWIVVTAFKSQQDILAGKHLMFSPTFENFRHLAEARPLFGGLLNSLIVSVCSTVVVMLVSVPAAYSFARFNPGGGHLLFYTLMARMFPGALSAIPLFLLFRELGLLDTHLGLSLLYICFNMSFATFLLYGYFREIPVSLEKAAMIDGYSRAAVLRLVVFPLIKPGLAVTALFCLLWSWNEFLFAFLFTSSAAGTVTVAQSLLWDSSESLWGPMAALMCVSFMPALLATWFMRKHIVRALSYGAVKR